MRMFGFWDAKARAVEPPMPFGPTPVTRTSCYVLVLSYVDCWIVVLTILAPDLVRVCFGNLQAGGTLTILRVRSHDCH